MTDDSTRADPVSTRTIRVLIVEDDPLDAELVVEQLRERGLALVEQVVMDSVEFERALDNFEPDIVLSDLALPRFSGHRALELLRARDDRTPFIFVSGTMGEAAAIDALRAGATDYVLKNNLARLAAAVERAVAEAAERRARDSAEAELIRAQRFETLAILTGSLGHDLRNTLQPVLLATQLIETRPEKDEVERLTAMIRDCCNQCLELVAAMLGLARGGGRDSSGKRVKLAALLDAVGMLLRPSVPSSVELVIDPVDSALEVPGSTTDFQQCLINLALNAIQSMSESGGRLEIGARRRRLDPEFFVEAEPRFDVDYLGIRVADTGSGMDADILAKLFTPFFTTKSGGNGLGLVSCRRFVDSQRGVIRVDSTPGKGSTFELFLPIQVEQDDDSTQPTQFDGAGQYIAVVSDDPALVSDVVDLLQLYAYESLILDGQGRGGSSDWERIRAIVIDSHASTASLAKAAALLEQNRSTVPVLLLGQAPSKLPPGLVTVAGRIDKPVTARALLSALAEVLEAD